MSEALSKRREGGRRGGGGGEDFFNIGKISTNSVCNRSHITTPSYRQLQIKLNEICWIIENISCVKFNAGEETKVGSQCVFTIGRYGQRHEEKLF